MQYSLSLQSGCDATLKRMNRHYTSAEYAAVCDELRKAFPGCSLTTDVMVGFPGEDEAEFEESLAFVQKIGFFKAHVFAYSRRPGTPAAKAPDQVPQKVKAARSRRMIAVGDEERDRQLAAMMGSEVEVLLETRNADGLIEGYTPTYLPVFCRTDKLPGDTVICRLTSHKDGACYGEEV